MFQTEVVEKIKTHILGSVTSPTPKNYALYELMWKNIVQRGRTHDNMIWYMPFACWINKVIKIHSECYNYCFSTAKMVAGRRLNVTFILRMHLLLNVCSVRAIV